MELDIESGLLQIQKAAEKENEQRHWDMYLSRYQHMTKQTFKPFHEFYKAPGAAGDAPVENQKSKDEIITDAEEILAAFRKNNRGGE
ncbi:hypothetical protein [Paenibacillus eucommiae]|uniref:Uncharacterized protein n=1 Tax=Paenibacillus eucommiae TaxID=1355755 RepID=A0ABS4IYB5_9BACL|nr:hypothetical protein [Paenibacillus eucommiae]MBP1992550.1 hypothetical protein [Paenibacillus eucommiae]